MSMNAFLSGAVAMASLVAALFFLRFWKQTRDRFFLLFSLAFVLDAADRMALGAFGWVASDPEQEPLFYAVRFVSYLVIIAAIIDKNTRGKQR
jgi:hypothetical protein